MTNLYILILGILILSCTGSGNQNKNSSQAIDASTVTSANSDTLYIAYGGEPGWKILVTSSNSLTNYDIALDYGSVLLNFDSQDDFSNAVTLSSDTAQVVIAIVDEECIDEGDRSFNTSISLTYLDREYLACGNKK